MGLSTLFRHEPSVVRCTIPLSFGSKLSKIYHITKSLRFPWAWRSGRRNECEHDEEREAAQFIVETTSGHITGDPAQNSEGPDVSRGVAVCTVLKEALELERAPESDKLSTHEASLSIQFLIEALKNQNDLSYRVRNQVRGLIARLSHTFQVLSPCLDLSGVGVPLKQPAGLGGLGNVFKGSYRGGNVAVKYLRSFQQVDVPFQDAMEALTHEVVCWFGLNHDFIVPFFGTIQRRDYPGYFMVSPWMENGEMISYLERKKLRDASFVREANLLLYQVAKGIEYLHKTGVVHGDIRGPNILIDDQGNARISDFGTATLVGVKNLRDGYRKGALVSRAPELIEPATDEPTFACDIYSFGMLCVELYLGAPPFVEMRPEHIVYGVPKGRRPTRPKIQGCEMPMNVWALVESCWHTRPCRRPNASQVVAILDKVCNEPTE